MTNPLSKMQKNDITELVDYIQELKGFESQRQTMEALKEKPQQYREWAKGNQPRDTAIFKMAELLKVAPEDILIVAKQYDKRGTEETKRYWGKKAVAIMKKIKTPLPHLVTNITESLE